MKYLSKEDEMILDSLNLEEPDLKTLQEAVFHAEKLLESAKAALESAQKEANRRPRAIAILEQLRNAGIGEEPIKAALLAQFGRVKSKTGPKPPPELPISQGLPSEEVKLEIMALLEESQNEGFTLDELYYLLPTVPQVSIIALIKNALMAGDVIKYKKIVGNGLQEKYLMKKYIGDVK